MRRRVVIGNWKMHGSLESTASLLDGLDFSSLDPEVEVAVCQGVISPLYLLNGIGSFLTRKGEGLIGFNFNLTGSAASPSVSVNPLSAFTPGMFREIFRRPVPEVTE